MSQHGGNDLYEIPNFEEELNNPELQAEYAMNRRHILAGDEDTDLKKVYNFPSNNLHGGFNEIRGHLNQIYNDQGHAFWINFSFGMILQNTETGEYRYYIPYFNNKMLQFPFTISVVIDVVKSLHGCDRELIFNVNSQLRSIVIPITSIWKQENKQL